MQIIRPLSVAVLAFALSAAGAGAAHAAARPAAHPAARPAAHPAARPAARPGSGRSFPRTDAVTVPIQKLTPRQRRRFSHLLHQQNLTAQQTSNNWAGYAATGSSYTSVSSSWTEPSVSCTSGGIVAFWIGLDGDGSSTVEQDGTGVDCSSGSPQQFAWWETYPANSIQEYSDPVQAGDSFTSTITAQGGGQYDYVLTDNTEGWTENQVVSASGSDASAEIIAEAVTSGSSVTPLPDFGSVGFNGSTIDGTSLASSGASAIDMVNSGGTVIASTGPVSGGSFTVSYGSGGGNPPPGNTVTVNSPGNQTSSVGAAADLQITGTDSGGAALSYSAAGLPAGAQISSSGLITGTLNTAGSYTVTVTATDSTGASGSTTFTWTVGSTPAGCGGVPAWSATTSYVPGDEVSYNGDLWKSTWYSTGAVPDAPGSWDVWQNEGAC